MSNNNNGPCGACKYLRRKCVKGCIFAPYFDSNEGTSHFAAVHKVFGASNASKLLLTIPAHKRLDAVLTLSYEALARLRDPIYGSVAHIFTLQQQVVSLQAELAYVQARLSTLAYQVPMEQYPQSPITMEQCPQSPITMEQYPQSPITMEQYPQSHDMLDQQVESCDLHTLTREFVSIHLPGVRFTLSP